MPRAWYREAFGRHYLEVYAHRDDQSARREVAFAADALGLTPGDHVLDLACGAGRHSRALAAIGCRVAGMDLSPELLASAGAKAGGPEYVRGDMRSLPFSSCTVISRSRLDVESTVTIRLLSLTRPRG